MRSTIPAIFLIATIFSLLNGCGRGRNLFRPADTDVTSSPKYNFEPFAGTVWKTKAQVALADIKEYAGEHHITLLPPDCFDPTEPNYTPAAYMKVIAVLPVGTRLRIERLMKDNGIGSLLWVTESLENVTPSLHDGRDVYVERGLLAKNLFIFTGSSDSKVWGVNSDMLEKAE